MRRRHVITHPYRPLPTNGITWLVGMWVIALLTLWTVLYQQGQARERACVRELTSSWSADPENVGESMPDYAWFESRCE